jgi:hypothetical protein
MNRTCKVNQLNAASVDTNPADFPKCLLDQDQSRITSSRSTGCLPSAYKGEPTKMVNPPKLVASRALFEVARLIVPVAFGSTKKAM